jgi:hypothetical protein
LVAVGTPGVVNVTSIMRLAKKFVAAGGLLRDIQQLAGNAISKARATPSGAIERL